MTNTLEQLAVPEMKRAFVFAGFLNQLGAPTPAQQWLERAAAQLSNERDADGSRRERTATLKVRIMERDGSDCWFCGERLGRDVTLEHLQPLALGGNWGEGNLALAHARCNKAAGHLSRVKKEEMREQLRTSPGGAGLGTQSRPLKGLSDGN